MTVKKVLVIDDEADLRKLIQTCLEVMTEWQVLTAGSGKEGLTKAQTQQADVILLDIMMPEMDGLATLQQLRANSATRHIPVILLTAKERSIQQSQFTNLNVCGTIGKPFNPLNLADQITAVLNK
ncbi:MAG: response regulator [Elainellaceae cyanobacterium]